MINFHTGTTIDPRTIILKEALNTWASFNFIGTLQVATGSGKTKMAVEAIKYVFKQNINAKVLIITPSEVIRDINFPKEFIKWGCELLLPKVNIECIQTAHKRLSEVWDLIVIDEIHTTLTECYSQIYEHNYTKLLGLSAWIPKDKVDFINNVCPIIYTLTTDEAVERGVVSDYIEYNIPVELSNDDKAIMHTIDNSYRYYERLLGGNIIAYDVASNAISKFKNIPKDKRSNDENELFSRSLAFYSIIRKRKDFLYELNSKKECFNNLLQHISLSKAILFSLSNKFASSLVSPDIIDYHSGLGKKNAKHNLELFMDNKVKFLSTCKKVNEGFDLPVMPAIINLARYGSPKDHIQKRGRCLRIEEGKIAYVFNIYVKDSQDEKWLNKSQSTTDKNKIVWLNNLIELPRLRI